MTKKYIFLFLSFLLHQWGTAQHTDKQRILSNLTALELRSKEDFAIFEDSLQKTRSVLTEEDLIVLYQRATDQSKHIQNDSLFFYYAELVFYTNLSLAKFDEAIAASQSCIDHASAVKDTAELILGFSKLGGSYMYEGSVIESYECFSKALDLAKIYQDKKLLNYVSINLSNCYNLMGREADAISLILSLVDNFKGAESSYALRALSTCYTILSGSEIKDTIGDINVIHELEQVTRMGENHPDFEQDEKLRASCGAAYYQLFHYYFDKKSNLEKGEYYYQKLMNADLARGFQKEMATFLRAVRNKDLSKAKTYINEENEKTYGEEYYLYALEYYKLTGNFERQLYYTNLIKDTKIENLKADKVNLNNFTSLQLENQEKAKAVALLEQEIKSQELQRIYFFAISFLLSGLLLSILFTFLQIKKRNKSLREQKNIIENQAEKLQEVNEQNSIFFANVAHEFQTPLSIITGLAKKIKSLDNIEEVKPLLPIIIRNGAQLSELTNQILDLTKNEETLYPLHKDYFYIDELIKSQLVELQHIADVKSMKMELQNTLDQHIVFSDIEKLKTIIKNLLSNAIKFSGLHSTVTIKLKTVDKKNIAIIVSDKGKGISKEDLPIIFDRFYQANTQKEEGGFGIGLAICKEYTDALEGRLEAQSILGEGSQFVLQVPTNTNGEDIEASSIITFPVEKSVEKDWMTTQTKQDKRILIVEDNLDFCRYLSSILANRYQLLFFHNGFDALDYLKSNSTDLIITDWMLPEMNGLTFLKTVKTSFEESNHIPVLLLTARGMITDQLKALREGADDFLIKTFEEEVLIERIEYLLSHANNGLSKPIFSNSTATSFSNHIVENISKQDQEWLLEFESIVSQNIQAFELNLDEMASLMNMSITHLGRKVKSITGITPKKYIQEMRFWEARRMLELGLVDSVKAACLSVGFKDQSHFSRRFKDKFGDYPSHYFKQSI